MKSVRYFLVLCGSAALLSCRLFPSGDVPIPEVTCDSTHSVYALQDPSHPDYTRLPMSEGCDFCAEGCSESMPVKLCGVVATSGIDGKLRDGEPDSFFVSDPEGGPYSGIKIYVPAGLNFTNVRLGDELTIIGRVEEFCGITEIQVQEQFIELTATGGTVAPIDIPGTCSVSEEHEGCLVRVTGNGRAMMVTDGPNFFGEAQLNFCEDTVVDDDYWNYTCGLGDGALISSVTGVVDNAWGSWRIYPRQEDDIVLFGDAAEPAPTYTIQQLQNCADPAHPDASKRPQVRVENVIIMTPQQPGDDRPMYVMDPAGGPWSGLYIYNRAGWGGTGIEPGDMVNLEGELSEFFGKTEITVSDCGVELVSKGNPLPAPIEIDTGICTLAAPQDNGCANAADDNKVGEMYEGSLVRITSPTPMQVTYRGGSWAEIDNCQGAELGDDYGVAPGPVGTTYSVIQGVVDYSFGAYVISPLQPEDLLP